MTWTPNVRVSLVIRSETIDPSIITEHLGLDPTRTVCKGSVLDLGNIAPLNVWTCAFQDNVESPWEAGRFAADCCRDLLANPKLLSGVAALRSQSEMWLSLVYFWNTAQFAYTTLGFSEEDVLAIAQTGVPLTITVNPCANADVGMEAEV